MPAVPINFATLQIIAPYAIAHAMMDLLESLMTAKLVDDITDTHSDKTRESWGQGVANIVTGFFGGMGGCAMIGQTMINVKEGGARMRASTFLAGVFLLVLVVALGRGAHPDGSAGRRDGHGGGRDVRLAQRATRHPSPDAQERDCTSSGVGSRRSRPERCGCTAGPATGRLSPRLDGPDRQLVLVIDSYDTARELGLDSQDAG